MLRKWLKAEDHRARAAAVRVLRYSGHQVEDQVGLLTEAAADEDGRVRLEAIVAASWLDVNEGMTVLNEVANHPLDYWMSQTYQAAMAHLLGETAGAREEGEAVDVKLIGGDLA